MYQFLIKMRDKEVQGQKRKKIGLGIETIISEFQVASLRKIFLLLLYFKASNASIGLIFHAKALFL